MTFQKNESIIHEIDVTIDNLLSELNKFTITGNIYIDTKHYDLIKKFDETKCISNYFDKMMCISNKLDYSLNKSILHDETHDKYINNNNIKKIKGCIVSTKDELLDKYNKYKDCDHYLILKQCDTTGGDGISVIKSLEDVNKINIMPNTKYILEEYINDYRTLCVQMYDNQIVEPISYEMTKEFKYIGTIFIKSLINKKVENSIKQQVKHLTEHLKLSGYWGVDFLVKNDIPYLIDLNLFRINGSHSAKIYINTFRNNEDFIRFSINYDNHVDISQYTELLKSRKDIIILEVHENSMVLLIIGDKCVHMYDNISKKPVLNIDTFTNFIKLFQDSIH
jgi:hypothetical protein